MHNECSDDEMTRKFLSLYKIRNVSMRKEICNTGVHCDTYADKVKQKNL